MQFERTIPHAVSAAGTNSYGFDCNGNMTSRNIGGQNYTLSYDADLPALPLPASRLGQPRQDRLPVVSTLANLRLDRRQARWQAGNRLTAVSGAATASFTYDGDGNRVKGTVGGVTTTYIGNYFEWTGSTSTMVKYYYAGLARVAMRTGTGIGKTGLSWLFGDHLGGTSGVANADGTPLANGEQRYKPWGEKRYPTGASGLPTTYRFTGERQETGLVPSGGEGLYWVGSRWLDPALGRWIQPDTDVPESQGVQAFDRYAYVNNVPTKYIDPSGHAACADEDCKVVEHPISGRLIFRRGFLYKNERAKFLPEITNKKQLERRENQGCGGRGCDLGGNIKKLSTDNNNPQIEKQENQPNPIGIGLGVILTGFGVAGFVIGIGVAFEDPPVGLLLASGCSVLAALGAEITYRSLGDLRPPSWPESLIINGGLKYP